MIFILSGCVKTREPQIPQFNSGIKKTKEWSNYNNYAEKNNKPILDFAATTLNYKFNKGKILSYDHFLTNDPWVIIETKWHNCKPSDILEFKFYMSDGRLYNYKYFKMKKVDSKYTIGRNMCIKNMFPSKIQGKWTIKIYTNKKFVMSKKFTIGNPKIYKQTTTDIKIGVFPYVDNIEMSTWKHGMVLPTYISEALLYNYKNVEIISPQKLLLELPNINIGYNSFDKYIKDDLSSNKSIILNIAKKYSLNYVILGKVQSLWQNGISNTKVNTYIVDVAKKQIIDTMQTTAILTKSSYSIYQNNRVKGIHPDRVKIYKQIYKNINTIIKNIVK